MLGECLGRAPLQEPGRGNAAAFPVAEAYYVYFKNFSKNRPYLIDEAKELKKNLGSNIKIHFTQNPRIIHERKIFIENLCITFDNSFQNITTTEPTWTIIVEYSEETKNDWLKKASSFKYFYH